MWLFGLDETNSFQLYDSKLEAELQAEFDSKEINQNNTERNSVKKVFQRKQGFQKLEMKLN